MNKYQIALLSVPFDNRYLNTIRFNTRAEQESYFNVNSLFSSAQSVLFNIGQLYKTSVTYQYPQATINNIFTATNSNYAIVKNIDNNSKSLNYFYYFVTDTVYDNANQITLYLELDVMQTFYIDLTFNDSVLRRGHISRFDVVNNSTGRYGKFKGNANSKLFNSEMQTEMAQRLIGRTHLIIDCDINTPDNEYNFCTYCRAWAYYYLKEREGGYSVNNAVSGEAIKLNPITISQQNQSYYVICFPMLFSLGLRDRNNNMLGNIDCNNAKDVIDYFGGEVNILHTKISALPPFQHTSYIKDYDWGVDNNNYYICTSGEESTFKNCTLGIVNNFGLIAVNTQYQGYMPCKQISVNNTYLPENMFLTNNIIGDDRKLKYEPKINSQICKSLKLVCGANSFTYDIQKMNSNNELPKFKYKEPLTPDITHGYCFLDTSYGLSNIYIEGTERNFTGLVYTADNSFPYSINQLETFLGNNKNFYLQLGYRQSQQGVTALSSSVGQLLGGNIVGGITSGVASATNIALDTLDKLSTLDNMKNAPESLANSNGSGIFSFMTNYCGIYVEYYSALDIDILKLADKCYMYGYTLNYRGNVHDIDNVRHYFNFVQCDIDIIYSTYGISNVMREKIREIFNNGITIWNVTDNMFNYDKENYERELEYEQI